MNNSLREAWNARFLTLRNQIRIKEAWVLGTGPSLNALNLDAIRGKLVIACNNAWLKVEEIGSVDYIYVVCDKHRLNEALSNPRRPKARAYMIGNHERFIPTVKECDAFGAKSIGLTQRPVRFIARRSWLARPFGRLRPFVARTVDKEWFCHEFSDGFNFGRTVVYTGIQIAHLLGAQVVRLLGVDARASNGAYFSGMPRDLRSDEIWLRNPRITLEPNLALARAHMEAVGKRLIDCSGGAITSLERDAF